MMHPLRTLDRHLHRLTRASILALTVCGVLIVGGVDYVTGYEVAMSLFYLGPVAVAAWYAGRWTGSAIAVLSCMSWYIADLAAGNQYSHPAIPVWNALIRFGFFFITCSLLTTLRNSLRAQQYLARTDDLTGLYGRREFESRLKHDLAMAQRRKSVLTLAYLDLDDFKAVNETHGHAGGDRVLRAIGSVLRSSVREVDTAARVGGDEFALILPDTDSHGAQRAISKLTRGFNEALGASDCEVTCSIGVVTLLDSATSPEHAVAAADELMYEVKNKGKGAVAFSVRGRAVQGRAAADVLKATRH
ncbi:MAG TPA: GGDEF domain-containing protein [Gammaproteobacteria bacterium]|nr:GGDEF domain-containing protein [Gammaproteobacteria bacterium]